MSEANRFHAADFSPSLDFMQEEPSLEELLTDGTQEGVDPLKNVPDLTAAVDNIPPRQVPLPAAEEFVSDPSL